jgi:multiple sugar transport system substrate-binding protein
MAGPHAILTFMSLCAALGEAPSFDDTFISEAVATEALAIMARILVRVPERIRRLNPIELFESMTTGEEIVLIPLVFGYVNYARRDRGRKRVVFADAPRARNGSRHGSVLGGTGIALTARAQLTPGLLEHLRWLMSDEAQTQFFTAHEGQPSARAAWNDIGVNQQWGNFYSATLATLDDAIVRPRYDGYIAFQRQASEIVRAAFADTCSPSRTLAQLRGIWKTSRANARGPLF